MIIKAESLGSTPPTTSCMYSVILDYPQGQYETVAAGFGLQKAEQIDVLYNK
jgi:hypothetical protein